MTIWELRSAKQNKQNKVLFPVTVVNDEGNNMQEESAEREPNNTVNLNIVSEASEANYPNANNNSSQYNTSAISQLSAKQESIDNMNSNISCEANEANCPNANTNPGQNNTNATRQLENQPIESITPKHRVPCPFLRKKGHCLKGSHCDFPHDIVLKHLTQYQRQRKFHPSLHKQKLDPFFNFSGHT